jgi:hypothetical protein
MPWLIVLVTPRFAGLRTRRTRHSFAYLIPDQESREITPAISRNGVPANWGSRRTLPLSGRRFRRVACRYHLPSPTVALKDLEHITFNIGHRAIRSMHDVSISAGCPSAVATKCPNVLNTHIKVPEHGSVFSHAFGGIAPYDPETET